MAMASIRAQPLVTDFSPVHSRSCQHPLDVWKQLQVSYYGGKYSIHRVLALETYTRNTSVLRALLVCISTPIPTIALVIASELIPLQDPQEGWRANYGFWIRTAIMSSVVGHAFTGQAKFLIDGVSVSELQLVALSAWASVGFIVVGVVVADQFVFPVPFFVLTAAPIYFIFLAITFRVTVGGEVFGAMLTHPDQTIRYIVFVCTQIMVAVVYPLYESLFRVVEGSPYQLVVVLLLPVIKVAVKNLLLRCTKHMEDMIPEAVIFTVDFFNAIYIATCMQSSTSALSVVAITVTDLLQTIIMLYGLHRRTAPIRSKLRHVVNNTSGDDVLEMISSICRDSKQFSRQMLGGITIRSCLPHFMDNADTRVLETLEEVKKQNLDLKYLGKTSAGHILVNSECDRMLTRASKLPLCFTRKRNDIIHPVIPYDCNTSHSASVNKRNVSKKQPLIKHPTILRETLEALFTMECLVTSAYLETVVPFFYCCYMLGIAYLPSSQYHTEIIAIGCEDVPTTVAPVFVFGFFQLVAFGLLAVLIRTNCGMRALYQLAFVLETQTSLIQGKLMIWMAVTVCCRVVHFGRLLRISQIIR